MELIDYLFLFWIFVVIATYVLGSLYEKHLRGDTKKSGEYRKSTAGNQHTDWPTSSADYSSTSLPSTQNYNSNQYSDNVHRPTYPQQSAANDTYASQQPTYSRDMSMDQATRNVSSTGAYQMSQQSSMGAQRSAYPNASHYNTDMYQEYRSKSSANSSLREQQSSDSTIPTATGFNSDCVEWVNSILYLFYTRAYKYGPIITESIYRSLNEKLSNITSSSAENNNLLIEFSGVNQELSSRPELTNIRTETESEKSVSAICKIYNKRLIFDLSIKRRNSVFSNDYEQDGLDETNYELTLENLEGKLKSMAMLSDKLIVVQFMERPDTKILLRQKQVSSYKKPLINEDTLVSMILQTLTQVVVDLYFGDDLDFPQYSKQSSNSSYKNKLNLLKGSANEIKRQFKHDFFGALSSNENKERKVFIKILKASNINYNQNVTCLLELDHPHQQALSSTKQGSNPYWDEHFLFTISDKSNELLIELWDSISAPADKKGAKSGTLQANGQQLAGSKKWSKSEITSSGKFLGLTRISVDELRREPVQKVSLMLQPRQETSDSQLGGSTLVSSDLSSSVGGELQLELLFLEHSNAQTPATSLQKSGSTNSLAFQQGDVISVDRKLTPSGYIITTTTITKPATSGQQQVKPGGDKTTLAQQRYEQLTVRSQSPMSSNGDQSELDINLDAISSSHIGDGQSIGPTASQLEGRSRSRSRSRSFLRAIKKRLSFSRTRSRSVGESHSPAICSEAPSSTANVSTNLDRSSIESRSRASSEVSLGRAKSVPASRDPSEVPIIVINKSRLSDTASAFTFAHPKSQLVIECVEPKLSLDGKQKQQVRHYLIPDSEVNKGKWRKRGLKLHVFNEHQFVASHLAGSSTCHLCGRVFSRRPGKQGYKCRNCHLLSHKLCHVKVDHNCPQANKEGLKLEFIDADPPAELMQESNRNTMRSNSLQRQTKRPMKLSSKSISMEVDDR